MEQFTFASILLFIICLNFSCRQEQNQPAAILVHNVQKGPFDDYWYQGKAEVTSYKLEQARYGEIHQGHAVLIFVTEDFSLSRQVKLDSPQRNPGDAVNVLKCNFTKKFNTGIYPYSMMASVFTPVDISGHPNTLKVTASSQEWCGHTYTQLNLVKSEYRVHQASYFESEGDRDFKLRKQLLEDEIWTRIRIDPKSLPTGDIRLIPGTLYSRLKHLPLQVEEARAGMQEKDKKTMTYSLEYKNIDRRLFVHFRKDFPHEISGWEEEYVSGWGANAKKITYCRSEKRIQNDRLLEPAWCG